LPSAPRKPCRKSGCNKLTVGTYCGDHAIQKQVEQKQERIKYDKERGTSASRGYTSRWSRVAKLYRIENPWCVKCKAKGILKFNECVDHIEPVDGPDDPKFWDESNWQGLCISCHSEKTASEDGALGNKKKERFL